MKKLIFILALISLSAFSFAQDRTGRIPTGFTMLDKVMTFTAADSIVTSDSLVIQVTNPQKYMQNVTYTATLDDVDGGSPSIVVTLRGKVTTSDSWHPIGTPVTWTAEASNPIIISSTSPTNYNWYKVSYVASGATQHAKVLTSEFKTSNAYDIPASSGTLTVSRKTSGTVTITSKDDDANAALTIAAGGTGALTIGESTSATAITGSAVNINASANIATNINTGTSNAALTLGGGSGTVAVNSSDWDITTAGVMTGIGAITTDGTFDNVVVNSVAGGDKGINESITQDATALTGSLIGAGIVATNGTSAAASGVVYGIEAKARAANSSNEGNTIGRLDGVYASVDAKNKAATIMRAFEASLDGAVGATSDEAVGFEAFNNSSGTQTASYAFSANGGTASGHKAYTADIRLQNGETVSNATDGTVAVSGVLKGNPQFATIVANTDESETLTAAQSGAIVTVDGAATITIPDPSAATVGVVYYLIQTADASLTVTCTTANSNGIVCDGVATSDSVAITTAAHQIGAGMVVIGISATKWYVGGLNPESVLTPEAAD